jgi:hypothetical protein
MKNENQELSCACDFRKKTTTPNPITIQKPNHSPENMKTFRVYPLRSLFFFGCPYTAGPSHASRVNLISADCLCGSVISFSFAKPACARYLMNLATHVLAIAHQKK